MKWQMLPPITNRWKISWLPKAFGSLSVDNTADSVNDASGKEPCKCTGWQIGKEWLEDKYTCPAHSDIDDIAYPVWAVNKEYLYDNADDCSSPYKDK